MIAAKVGLVSHAGDGPGNLDRLPPPAGGHHNETQTQMIER
ncbi:hypothetical protein ABZ917_23340 [Nonomuraea wenchangensis]